MTFWDQMRQMAVNVTYRRELKIEDPDAGWKMLAGAVILQGLLDDLHYHDRMEDSVYRFYADMIGIEEDYVILLMRMIQTERWWRRGSQKHATAFLDIDFRKSGRRERS